MRNIALLAPALMLHDELLTDTYAAAESGCLADIVYNFRSEATSLPLPLSLCLSLSPSTRTLM